MNYTKDSFKYDRIRFNFSKLILDAVNINLKDNSLNNIKDLSEIHNIADIKENLEKYRQVIFSEFRSNSFQAKYIELGKWIIDSLYTKDALLQKTPTIRIQLPDAKSVSFHTDEWYGHGKKVNSFWLPLTKVSGVNSLQIARNSDESKELIKSIEVEEMDLDQINNEAIKICEPIEASFGDIIIFNKDIIHGTVKNTTNQSRVSFDFRIAPNKKETGNKPIANFYTYADIENPYNNIGDNYNSKEDKLIAIAYTGIAKNVSSKNQLIFLNEYGRIHNIKIIMNESEIIKFNHCPVLKKYSSNPESMINCILLFSLDLLPSSFELRRTIYNEAINNKIKIIFTTEDIILSRHDDIKNIEKLILRYQTI